MRILKRTIVCFGSMALMAACRTTVTSLVKTDLVPDTALFALVISENMKQIDRDHLRVDPRPFRFDTGPAAATATAVRDLPELVEPRARVLQRLHIDPVDATIVGMNARCPGVLLSPDAADTAAVRAFYSGCPRTMFYVLSIDIPRAGEKVLAGINYDFKTLSPAAGYWAVRARRTFMTPTGASTVIADYVVQAMDSGWRCVRRVLITAAD